MTAMKPGRKVMIISESFITISPLPRARTFNDLEMLCLVHFVYRSFCNFIFFRLLFLEFFILDY